MTFTKEQLTRIIESADEVITALAGTNDDIHPDNSTKMCAAWDHLNDVAAPPSVVKRLAELALAGMEAEPVKRVNSDQMHRVCLEATRHLDKYGAMAKEVNKLLGRTAPQPLTTSERAELENYRNAQQVVPYDVITRLTHEANHVTAWHHMDEHSCKVYRRDLLALVNACRAAFIAASEGNKNDD